MKRSTNLIKEFQKAFVVNALGKVFEDLCLTLRQVVTLASAFRTEREKDLCQSEVPVGGQQEVPVGGSSRRLQ